MLCILQSPDVEGLFRRSLQIILGESEGPLTSPLVSKQPRKLNFKLASEDN